MKKCFFYKLNLKIQDSNEIVIYLLISNKDKKKERKSVIKKKATHIIIRY